MLVIDVAKVLVLTEESELLLLTRAAHDASRAGEPDFPGGSVNEGEPEKDAAVRELYEETSIEVNPEDLEEVAVDWTDEEHKELTKGSKLPYAELNRRYFLLRTVGRLAVKTDPKEHSAGEWFAPDAVLQQLAPKPSEPANARWYMRRVAAFVFEQEARA